MIKPINILDSGKEIELHQRTYKISIIGGWSVKLNNFKMYFKEVDSDKIIEPKLLRWRIQSHKHGQRIKRIGTIYIPKYTKCTIHFTNPDSLQVKQSNLIITSIFQNYIPSELVFIDIS